MAASPYWNYFKKNENQTAECYTCKRILKTGGGSTKALKTHIEYHSKNKDKLRVFDIISNSINYENSIISEIDGGSDHLIESQIIKKRRSSLHKYFQPTLQKLVSKYAAHDGFSLRQIVNSSATRGHAASMQLEIPRSENTIREYIFNYYEIIKKSVKAKILEHIKTGSKVSISIDEWTCLKNNRFININLFFMNNFYNLGLIRIKSRADSYNIKLHTLELLKEFGIDYENNVLGVTSDGAAVMKASFGKDDKVIHQLCLNHALHLAILDVFYKKNIEIEENINKEQSEFSDSTEDDFELAENLKICNDEKFNQKLFSSSFNIQHVIMKVRKTVKKFKKSGFKQDLLNDNITKNKKKIKSLSLDVKTRWNSVLKMLVDFNNYYEEINEALKMLSETEYLLTEPEIKTIQEIIKVLSPINKAVELLGRTDCSIFEADVIFA